MYHSIEYTPNKKDKITVSPDAFTRQMKFLHDRKYNVIPLEEAVSYIREKKRPPARTVAITFDDGYENNYKYAYPALKRYHMPATIFIITDKVGKNDFMDWGQINEMSASGIIDIESHTISHAWLKYIDDKKLKDELAGSKEVLEKMTGKKIKFICYPMGGYNEHVKSMAKDAGYEAGFATKPTRLAPSYDVYEIKRVRISPTADNLFVYWIKLSGYHAFFRALHEDSKKTDIVK
jgi:peptidoglycan/xylan/chitin deacetylase (PgdA/CDA1 family)